MKEMPDVERNGRIFSDGVGTISMEALKQVWDGMRAGRPTVLQIRFQGMTTRFALNIKVCVPANLPQLD